MSNSLELNYGYLKVGSIAGRFEFYYNGKGFSTSLPNTWIDDLQKMLNNLETIAKSNIDRIKTYIDYIIAGKTVVLAKSGAWMVHDIPELAYKAATQYQGGYIKTFTLQEIKETQLPYVKMFEDAQKARAWLLNFPNAPLSTISYSVAYTPNTTIAQNVTVTTPVSTTVYTGQNAIDAQNAISSGQAQLLADKGTPVIKETTTLNTNPNAETIPPPSNRNNSLLGVGLLAAILMFFKGGKK